MTLILSAVVSCLSLLSVLKVYVTSVTVIYTPACQSTLNFIGIGEGCTWNTISLYYEINVRLGFCTENEYSNMKATRCSLNSVDYPVSDDRENFYTALNNVSNSCQKNSYYCFLHTVLSVLFKQQEMFCTLMNLNISGTNTESCLTQNTDNASCKQDEIQQLKSAACKVNTTDADQTFSKALLNATTACQLKISQCGKTIYMIYNSFIYEQYCDLLMDEKVEACFTENNQCTAGEITQLKTAACKSGTGNLTSVISTYSQACQTILPFSKNLVALNLKSLLCTLEKILSGYEFRVRLGFCTENEYSNLTATICGGNSTSYSISDARKTFYTTLNNVSTKCQQRSYDCILTSVVGVVLKQQEQFCSLMNLNISGITSENCFTNGPYNCTLNEFNAIKSAACSVNTTNVDQTFSKSILDTTTDCQSQISQCINKDSEAWSLVLTEKYCTALMIGGNFSSTAICFKQNNQCTVEEVDKMGLAACVTKDLTTVNPTVQSTLQSTVQSTIQSTIQSIVQTTSKVSSTTAWSLTLLTCLTALLCQI